MKNFEIAINERVIEVIKFILSSKIESSKAELAEKLGVKPAKFSEILNKRMKAGMDIIQRLCNEYNVSADWIITGRGDMLLNNCQDEATNTNNSNNISRLITILQDTLVEKDKQIDRLLSIIEQGKV